MRLMRMKKGNVVCAVIIHVPGVNGIKRCFERMVIIYGQQKIYKIRE